MALADSPLLGTEQLAPRIRQFKAGPAPSAEKLPMDNLGGALKERMERLEMHVVREAMQRHRGNKSRAARELGLSRVGLRGKLARYGLESDE